MFLIEIGARHGDRRQMVNQFGLTPAALFGDATVPGGLTPVLTLVSYMFLHADIVHILGNMVFLWVFGDNVEEAMGRLALPGFLSPVRRAGGARLRRQRSAFAGAADRRLGRDRGRGRSPI